MAGVTRDLHPPGSGSGAEESTHPRLGSKGIGGTGASLLVVLPKAAGTFQIGGLAPDWTAVKLQ